MSSTKTNTRAVRPPQTGQPLEKKAQRDMTKAERRELQEKQKAAKAASATTKDGQAAKMPKPKPAGKPIATPNSIQGAPNRTTGAASTSTLARGPKGGAGDVAVVQENNTQTRGLRIFSHFGQPKPSGKIQGDIHPSIETLSLLFSSFKVTGANARCIATLGAFKIVSVIARASHLSLTHV